MTGPGVIEAASTPATSAGESHPVSLGRTIRSEWIKFRSLRSSLIILLAVVAGLIGIGLIVAYNTRHLSANLQPDDLAPSATQQGYILGQFLIGALGVLIVSGEYSTGMIRSSFAAVPKRLPVLWAKLIVFTGIVAVVTTVVATAAFLIGQGVLSQYRTGYSLGDPGVLRVVLGVGGYLTLVGLFGSAIGWIVCSTPGALVGYFAGILVLPVIFGNLLGAWGRSIAKFMPSEAGRSFISSIRAPDTLSPWAGIGVLALWVVAAFAVALVLLRRRDA